MSRTRYFDLFITDLDGTLVDSDALVMNCVKHAARQRGFSIPRKREILAAYYETPSPTRLLKKFGMSRDGDKKNFWNYYEKNLGQLTLKGPDIVSSLVQMKADGLRMGLVTSLSEHFARQVLSHFDIGKFFQESRYYRRGCPKHCAISEITSELDVENKRTFYVGDSPKDVTSANKAGCWSGAIAWGNAKLTGCLEKEPDFLFYSFEMLSDLMLKRVTNREDCFTPSEECYTPHTKYVEFKHLIPHTSCRHCWFSSDCWNCAKFVEADRVSFNEKFLKSLKGVDIQRVVAAEWYVDRRTDAGHDISQTLRRFKSGHHQHLFRVALATHRCLTEISKLDSNYRDIDYIVPVPPSKKREEDGSKNPPEEICKVLKQLTGIHMLTPLRRKSKWSMRRIRGSYNLEERIEKVFSDLEINGRPRLKDKLILLVDDIITDGASILGVARKLREASGDSARVVGLVFGCTRKAR